MIIKIISLVIKRKTEGLKDEMLVDKDFIINAIKKEMNFDEFLSSISTKADLIRKEQKKSRLRLHSY